LKIGSLESEKVIIGSLETVSCATFHKRLWKKIDIVNYEQFSTKSNAHEMFGSREFRTTFRVAQKTKKYLRTSVPGNSGRYWSVYKLQDKTEYG